MKKLFLSLAVVSVLLGLASCSGDGKPLSASSAKSALKKEAVFAKDSQVTSFEIGFQEVSEEYLQNLARLKAAGVIDYTAESVKETRYESYGSYWTGYYKRPYEVTHIFADVKLTPEGEKLVIENPTELREDQIKDFAANKDYEEKVPDYMSASDYSFSDAPAPVEPEEEVVEVEEVVEEVVEDSVDSVEEAVEVETPQPKKPEPKKEADPNAAYQAMLNRVNTTTVKVLVGRFEIVKVKEVLCTEDMFKDGRGSCTVLYKFVDKTPFGFVFNAPQENYIQSVKVNFIHYQDLGWTLVPDND